MSLRWRRSSPQPDESLQLVRLPKHDYAPQQNAVRVDPRGIGALSIHLENLELTRSIAQEASSLTYSTLAAAIDIGLSMLETQHGRRSLRQELGRQWKGAGPRSNKAYVDHFLRRIRHDFPWVVVERMSPNVIVAARRLDRLTKGSEDSPKRFGLYFNYYGVTAMVHSCGQAPTSRTMRQRFHTYLFKFACAIAHEVCTLLVSHSHNHLSKAVVVSASHTRTGFDNMLFGGHLKFYANEGVDGNHPGVPHVLDERGVSHQVDPDYVRSVVLEREYTFPLQVTGRSYTAHDRATLRLQNMGALGAGYPPPSDELLMEALSERHLRVYDVSESDLRRIPHRLGPLKKAVTVVYVR
ncbi:hypothetical protein OQA88_8251 [Cercophora sp. LCS_1]